MTVKRPIYLDSHATTPIDPLVLAAMQTVLTEDFGNPSSSNHVFGQKAKKWVDQSRLQIAAFLGCEDKELIFTSGATESNNLALKGIYQVFGEKGMHIITQVTEHKSVLETCKSLEKQGMKVTYLPVDSKGQVRLEELKKAISSKTVLISIMHANNEIGTLQPIEEIGKIAKERKIFFHVDAAQSVGKIPLEIKKRGIDLLSFSAHKMYGPKGVGVLFVRREHPRVRLLPLLHGGGQEENLRSGTLNVPGIVGLAKACQIAEETMSFESKRMSELRNRLHEGILRQVDQVELNGHPTERLPHNLNLSFAGVDGESLLTGICEEIAVSSGSACIQGQNQASYVLKALGVGEERLHQSVRFGLGRFNTVEEIDYTIDRVVMLVKRLRKISPLNAPLRSAS